MPSLIGKGYFMTFKVGKRAHGSDNPGLADALNTLRRQWFQYCPISQRQSDAPMTRYMT